MKDKLIPWRKRALRHDMEWDENPFDMLHREVNDLFDTYYRGAGPWGRHTAGGAGFELSETDEEIRVKAELPGVDENDIRVTLEENMLRIQGEHKQQSESKRRDVHVSSLSYGSFNRTVPLPSTVDWDKARAKFKRGVLTLTLPKTEQAKAERRRIPVSAD